MSLFGKLLKYTLIALLALILTLILVAELAEDTISKMALNSINESFDAEITVDDIDFSLIKNFPLATIELEEVAIKTHLSWQNEPDTLASVKRIFVAVKALPLIQSEIDIEEINVEDGRCSYFVYDGQQSNFDALMPTASDTTAAVTDTSQSSLKLALDHFELNRVQLTYSDTAKQVQANLNIDNILASVVLKSGKTSASFKGQFRVNNCNYASTPLYLMKETQMNINAKYTDKNIIIENLAITTDGAHIATSGNLNFSQDIYANLKIEESKFEIAELTKYTPDSLTQAFGLQKIGGTVQFQAQVQGLYNDSVMPNISAQLRLGKGQVVTKDYPALENIVLKGNFTNGKERSNASTQINIDSLSFATASSKGIISGHIKNLDKIHFAVSSNIALDLNEIKPYVPDTLLKSINGQLITSLNTKGTLPDSFTVAYVDKILATSQASVTLKNVDAQINDELGLKNWNGTFKFNKNNFKLDTLNGSIPEYHINLGSSSFNGSYIGKVSQLDQLQVKISQLQLNINNSNIRAELEAKNMMHPSYQLKTNLNLDLQALSKAVPDTLIKSMDGGVAAQFISQGKIHLDSIAEQIIPIFFNNSQLVLRFDNASVTLPDTSLWLKNMNGEIDMRNDHLICQNLNGNFSNTTFKADTFGIESTYKAYFAQSGDTIKALGHFELGNIDYALFEPFMLSDKTTATATNTETEETTALPRFNAKGSITVNSFKYQKALFSNISTLFNISNDLYIIDQFKVDAFKGHVNSSVKVQMLPDNKKKTNFKTSVNNLDINQLLVDFDDFKNQMDSTYISHTQLSGSLSTDNLNGYILMQDSVITDSIMMSGDLRLEKGKLKNYDIAVEMGKELNIDSLDYIKFKTLDTKFFIYNDLIYIPQTDIKTNTFDVSIIGTQNFNLDCEHHIRVYLKEILRKGKTNRIERKQANEKLKKDGTIKGLTSVYAFYKSNGDDTKYGIEGKDSKERREMKRNINIKQAFSNLVFHPNLVDFDTNVKNNEY